MLHPKVLSIINSGKAIDSAFEGFWKIIQPENFPPNMPIEMRKAWFCGAFAMMELMGQISDLEDENQSVKLLEKISQELRREIKTFAYPFEYKF